MATTLPMKAASSRAVLSFALRRSLALAPAARRAAIGGHVRVVAKGCQLQCSTAVLIYV